MGTERRLCADCDCAVCGFYDADFDDPAQGFGGSVGRFTIRLDSGEIEDDPAATSGERAMVKALKKILRG